MKIKHGKWTITCKKGLWEATYGLKRTSYVNFSQEPDTSLENIKRILDQPSLRREQDARVLKRLKELEDYINVRLVYNPRKQGNEAKRGEQLNVGRALCEIEDKRLFRLTKDSEKYLELNRLEAEVEAKIRAELKATSPEDCESFFSGLTYHELEIAELVFGIRPSDYGITRKEGPAKPLTAAASKCWAMLEYALGDGRSGLDQVLAGCDQPGVLLAAVGSPSSPVSEDSIKETNRQLKRIADSLEIIAGERGTWKYGK